MWSSFKDTKVKERRKKIITCNVQSPPLSFIHVPFDTLRVILNDAFYEAPHAKIQSAMRATITSSHVIQILGGRSGLAHLGPAPLGKLGNGDNPPPPPQGRRIKD